MVVVQMNVVENGEIYGTRDINFTIASFAANGRSQHSLPSVGKPTAPLGQWSSFVPSGSLKAKRDKFWKANI